MKMNALEKWSQIFRDCIWAKDYEDRGPLDYDSGYLDEKRKKRNIM